MKCACKLTKKKKKRKNIMGKLCKGGPSVCIIKCYSKNLSIVRDNLLSSMC